MYKQLFLGTVGIYTSYLIMSYISQGLYNHKYIANGQEQQFTYSQLVVWTGALMCALYGYAVKIITNQKPNPIPIKEQVILGGLYTFNILPAYQALIYVSYPLHVLARNCRLLLVAIVGIFFSRVKSNLKLPLRKIYTAIVITIGVILFSAFAKDKDNQQQVKGQEWKGYLLLLLSILCDALFSDSQAYSKENYKPTSNHLFTSANTFTFALVFVYSIGKGNLISSLQFCWEHKYALVNVLLIAVLQVLGQVTIYYVIARFKQHVFPMISTTRKMFTVLVSIYFYNHSINSMQWLAMVLVFAAMGYEVRDQVHSIQHKKQ